jgi:hypothetical protein
MPCFEDVTTTFVNVAPIGFDNGCFGPTQQPTM